MGDFLAAKRRAPFLAFPEETASNKHFDAPLEVLVPAKRGTASFRNVLHPLKI